MRIEETNRKARSNHGTRTRTCKTQTRLQEIVIKQNRIWNQFRQVLRAIARELGCWQVMGNPGWA
jgi:hypothetical protein